MTDTLPSLKTSYFSFGQSHVHRVLGKTFDCDVIVKITDSDPRAKMVQLFGNKWCFEYDTPPRMEFFPRGIIEIK